MAFWAAIPAIMSAISAAQQAGQTVEEGETPQGQFGQMPSTSANFMQAPKQTQMGVMTGRNYGISGRSPGTPGPGIGSIMDGIAPGAPDLGNVEGRTVHESAGNKAMEDPGGGIDGADPEEIKEEPSAGGSSFADIMKRIALGAKIAQAMRSRKGPAGPLINFGGAASGGFGGAPVSQGFIQPQNRGTTFGQLAQRLRR